MAKSLKFHVLIVRQKKSRKKLKKTTVTWDDCPHSTEIFRKYCKNIPWKYCKIAKIFRNLSLILLKYCNNLVMSAQNMTYAIFFKYCQNTITQNTIFKKNILYRKLCIDF